jgi:hypothetical protein
MPQTMLCCPKTLSGVLSCFTILTGSRRPTSLSMGPSDPSTVTVYSHGSRRPTSTEWNVSILLCCPKTLSGVFSLFHYNGWVQETQVSSNWVPQTQTQRLYTLMGPGDPLVESRMPKKMLCFPKTLSGVLHCLSITNWVQETHGSYDGSLRPKHSD